MAVNDLAGEGQGTETRILVSLQWHSDRTGQSCSKSPLSCTLVGNPHTVLGKGRGEWGSIRGSEQSSKVAGQELTWRNWDFLVVPVTSTTLRSRRTPLPQLLFLLPLPPSPPNSHRVAKSYWSDQGIKTCYVHSDARWGSWLDARHTAHQAG